MTGELQALLGSRCRRDMLRVAAVVGGCFALAVVAVLLALAARGRARNENLQEQNVVADTTRQDSTGTGMAAQLPRLVSETRRLQSAGFTAPADRVAWVDAASRTLQQLHPVAYTVEARVAQTQPATDSLQQRYQQAGLEPPQFERNDLLLNIQGLQEDELADVIEQIGAQGGGLVRTEHCKIARRFDGVGLDVECTLARYRLLQAAADPPS